MTGRPGAGATGSASAPVLTPKLDGLRLSPEARGDPVLPGSGHRSRGEEAPSRRKPWRGPLRVSTVKPLKATIYRRGH